MIFEDFINEFEDLRIYLERIYDEHESELIFTKNELQIPVPLLGDYCKVNQSQLLELIYNKKANGIPGLKYLESYGVKFKSYYEICIKLSSDTYMYFEGYGWPTTPLKFKIDSVQFEVSSMSSLMSFLTEPVFGDSDFNYDFHNFASIKMILRNGDDFKAEFSKGLYYLNSHYLKPISFYAKINSVEFINDDPFDLYLGEDPEKFFKVAKRTRNFNRKGFIKTEPIVLYNYATTVQGEQRFISYYRVLEFFMAQGIIQRVNEIRFDSAISDEQLIREVSLRYEEEQLNNVLKIILTPSKKRKLMDYCIYHGLVNERSIKKITTALYTFRNSLVHAKEKEKERTNFPDPFNNICGLNNWIYITEELAKECISRFNTKPLNP